MDPGLIAAHRGIPAVMPYLHLPVQSGSNTILAAMNRRHDRDAYLRLIDEVRAARPDIALSSDFIVGFPGETDADFADTLDLIERVGFAASVSFKYSPRPGTPAADSDDQVPTDVMAERLAALQALRKTPGKVLAAPSKTALIVSLGSKQGFQTGDKLLLYETIDTMDDKGAVVFTDEKLVGEITLESVQEERSKASYAGDALAKPGWVVKAK